MAESLDLEKMNIDAEALNYMAQGKRNLLVRDYNAAVQALEQACKLYDEKYGVSADECADAYLNYGHALLELHRQETGALDGIVDSKQEGSDLEDEDEEDEEIDDDETKTDEQPIDGDKSTVGKVETNGNTSKTNDEEDISVSPTPAEQLEKNSTTSTTTTEEKPAAASSSSNGNANGSSKVENEMETDVDPNQPSTSTGITNENRAEEEEEDTTPSNIEVAFEVLTMAKNIYVRQTEYRDDAFVKLSDAQQKLGEILIEWENNDEALKELTECLEIRKRHLPDDDRLIAEVYYHIGLTHSLNSNITEANANYQRAIDVIEHRLNRLKSSYTSEPEGENRVKIENEIKDLEFVLPEMKSKIEDSQDQMSTSKLAAVVEENDKLEEAALAEKKKQIQAKPISNLTHLVKRKREETVEPESNKRSKTTNGLSTNEATNNVEEMKED